MAASATSPARAGALTRRTVLAAGAAGGIALAVRRTAAAESKDIVWGAALPLSGPFAAAGQDAARGLGAFVAYLNEGGGLGGRAVRLEIEDSGYMPDRAVGAFQRATAAEPPAVAYLGDSAGFAQRVAPLLAAKEGALFASTAFSSAVTDVAAHPLQFVPGPSYADMVRLLLMHLAGTRPASGAAPRVALVHSATEFGRDPLDAATKAAEALGVTLAAVIETKVAGAHTGEVLGSLVRARADAVIFHGYLASVWPEVVREGVARGLDIPYCGTYWAMEPAVLAELGAAADRYYGVMPYRYWWEQDEAPMLATVATRAGNAQPSSHVVQAWLVGMIFAESIRRTLAAGAPLEARHLRAALDGITDWDTGGLIGLPVRFVDNRIPIGRIYRGDAAKQRFEPVSDWLRLP